MHNKHLLKIDSRHPSVQNKTLQDGFHGSQQAMDDYRLLENGGLPAYKKAKPIETKLQTSVKEYMFRKELRKELEAPYERPVLDLGEAAAAELAEVVPIAQPDHEPDMSGARVVGYIIEDPREKIA